MKSNQCSTIHGCPVGLTENNPRHSLISLDQLAVLSVGFMPRLSRIGFFLAVASTMSGGTFEYVRAADQLYDEARLVGAEDFVLPKLMEIFNRFSATECRQQKLARLTIAVNNADLMNIINVSLPAGMRSRLPALLKLDRSLLGADLDRSMAAQVLCFGGNATASVRQGPNLSRYQLRGSNEAKDIKINDLRLSIVGFSLSVDSVSKGADHLKTEIRLFARTPALPTENAAKAVRVELERLFGVPTYLFLRTDSHFFDYGGPRSDAFEKLTGVPSIDDFLTKPFIDCWPDSRQGGCRIMKCHTLSLMEMRRKVEQ